MNHNRLYYRKQRVKHIKRKQRMMDEWKHNGNCLQLDSPLGKLSKGKIHCSCPCCSKKSHDHKKANDSARLEAMKQSEKYYQIYGYEFEDYDISDAEWRWIQIEEYWYYEDGFYHDWLVDHPNSSTDI